MKNLVLATLLAGTFSFALSRDCLALDPHSFANPPREYRPIDCWWWDGGEINEEKLRDQLEDMHAKGVGGTWLYPRFGAEQPLSGDPGFWTDGWWDRVRFTLREQKRLGMSQWANDWLGRLDKAYFQNQLRAERDRNPDLWGERLRVHFLSARSEQPAEWKLPALETLVSACAYRSRDTSTQTVDTASRIDLAAQVENGVLDWSPPTGDWLVLVITRQRHDLNYLTPAVARRWIDIYFEEYERRLGDAVGTVLTAYGPDERSVLDGNILYSDELRQRFQMVKGYDPLPELAALFIDIGPRTNMVRCDYYEVMITLVEENLYRPIADWLHDHQMKQVTIATWGREDMLGQTRNYGDFFRFMRHFDVPGNEDSQESGDGAFIDSKLSSSIAHLYGRPRVAVCAYWGTGWGFTQEQNLARTNVNFALGATLYNTHGVLYSLMGGHNEFVPPEVHFYQPYWKTWRNFTDHVTRTCYALSQGTHQADVALLYPLSTLHAHWHSGTDFEKPAADAERTCFSLAKALFHGGIDFNFINEASLKGAATERGRLQVGGSAYSVLLWPAQTTIQRAALKTAVRHVEQGGLFVVVGDPPSASAEYGRDDPEIDELWKKLLSDEKSTKSSSVVQSHPSGGKTILLRSDLSSIPAVLRQHFQADVTTDLSDIVHTHQKVGNDHLYFFLNKYPEARDVVLTVAVGGTPEIWDASRGTVREHHRFERLRHGTKLRLTMGPHEGTLVRIIADRNRPAVVSDNLQAVTAVTKTDAGYIVHGVANHDQAIKAVLDVDSARFVGEVAAGPGFASIPLDGSWECEYQPTMNNRWGDFRYPAADEWIGPETPRLKYRRENNEENARQWLSPDFDDRDWDEVQVTYGPYWQLATINRASDSPSLIDQITSDQLTTTSPLEVNGKNIPWETYGYSWKHGVARPDVHQHGMDGLGPVSLDYLVFDPPKTATVRYLVTRIYSEQPQSTYLHFGNRRDRAPRQAWLNGQAVVQVDEEHENAVAKVNLNAGWNRLVLRIEQSPKQRFAMFAIFAPTESLPSRPRYVPISPWLDQKDWRWDCLSEGEESVGCYRFFAPPGCKEAILDVSAKSVEAWIDGKPVQIQDNRLRFPETTSGPRLVALRIEHKPGCYEGAAFDGPIRYVLGKGQLAADDWSNAGLRYYSGGIVYRRTLHLNADQIEGRVFLDLGDVRTSAEVTINGQLAGVRLMRPFRFDITPFVEAGDNTIEVEVLNTLANFMSDLPTRYVYEGQTVSGILGPARVELARNVVLTCTRVHEEP